MPPRSRQAIPIWRKQEVIQWIAEEGENKPSRAEAHFRAKGLDVDGAAIRKWWRCRDEIMAAKPHQKRLSGGGRKPISVDMEVLLYDEIIDKRLRKEKVTRAWIMDMAQAIYTSLHVGEPAPKPFAASTHWLANFMTRFELSLRRRTNLTILTDDKLVSRAISYMRYLSGTKPSMNMEKTVLMDETAVYFEDARTMTVDQRGARHVVVRSTGFASMRITVILAVTATGIKLVPVLIWKGKNVSTFEKINGVYVTYQPKAWVDSSLLKRWIDLQFPLLDTSEGRYLVWDSMRAHMSKDVKAKCQTRKIGMCVVPGGLTPYLQAGDIAIYRSFKDILCAEINAWKESDQVSYTKFGNPRPPDVKVVCEWVKRAWRETDPATVCNSIAAAGFSDNVYDWHIARHDVYGDKFMAAWDTESGGNDEEESFNLHELDDCLDEISILHDDE